MTTLSLRETQGQEDAATFHTLLGNSGERFGSWISDAGDVDGDGIHDIIVGAPSSNDTGAAFVYSGADPNERLHAFYGDTAGDYFGRSVSGAGDVNGDGYADLIIGASSAAKDGINPGAAYVYDGATGIRLHTFYSPAMTNADRFGQSVSGAGDLNNDGFDDIAVGAKWDDTSGTTRGAGYFYSGVTGNLLFSHFGVSNYEQVGMSISDAGDTNGDGYDDVLIGSNRGGKNGWFYILSGSDGAVLHRIQDDIADTRLGISVAGIGDLNGDSYDDVIAGAPLSDVNGENVGKVNVYSGIDGALLYTIHGENPGDQFGSFVHGVGDANDDGTNDFIVGAPYKINSHGLQSGGAYVFSGADGAIIFSVEGKYEGELFGISVSGAGGDLSGDGRNDILVGAQGNAENGAQSGAVYIMGDECLDDPAKGQEGQCGCGIPDTDTDGDGFADCLDICDADPNKIVPGTCGCGASDTDSDGDGTADCNDSCSTDSNKTEAGICGCGVADTDSDDDGTADCNDSCSADPLKIIPGVCGCGTSDTDSDSDGVLDCFGDIQASPPPPAVPTTTQEALPIVSLAKLLVRAKGKAEKRQERIAFRNNLNTIIGIFSTAIKNGVFTTPRNKRLAQRFARTMRKAKRAHVQNNPEWKQTARNARRVAKRLERRLN